MLSTLVDLLGNFYVSNDLPNFEAIARSIHAAVPGDQVSLQFLGLAYYRTGRVKDAIRIFDRVVRRRKPTHELERRQGPRDDSATAACYREATRHCPELAQAWYDLGMVLQDLGKYEQAIPAYRSALIAQPKFPQALLAMGRAALHVDDLTAAEDGFSHLRALQPNNDEAYRGLGQIYRKRRDFATARACFVRVRMLRKGIDNLANHRCSKKQVTR